MSDMKTNPMNHPMNDQSPVEIHGDRQKPSPGWSLKITGGLHRGAVLDLPEDQVLLIGGGGDCDFRLSDEGLSERHIAVVKRGDKILLKGLEAAAQYGKQMIEPGVQMAIGVDQVVRLLPTTVTLELQVRHSPATARSAENGDTDKDIKQSSGFELINGAGVLLILLAVWFLGAINTPQSLASEGIDIQAASAILVELDLQRTVQLKGKPTYIVVKGVLTQDQMDNLRTALEQQNIPHRFQIKTDTRLLEQVRDVFRINGYGVHLEYLGDAIVEVKNLDGSNPNIQQVAAYVKQDVGSVAELKFAEYQNPESVGEDGNANYYLDSEKRLTAIVDGDTAYVATADGGRYFVGSLLPGGYAIRHIGVDGVQVDKKGELTWLQF